jgi:hypothetical protein
MAFNFLGFKVNVVDNSAFINMGPNQFIDLFVSYKRNMGVGEQNGDLSPINIPITYVIDTDLNDSNSAKNSII